MLNFALVLLANNLQQPGLQPGLELGKLFGLGEIFLFSPLGPAWAALRPRGDSFIFTTGASMGSSLAQGRFFYFHHWGQHGQLFGPGEILLFSPLGLACAPQADI